ncbi:MAG: phosphopantothenoylcysteine decarboxylase, partial [Ruminococcus sp.]|nr:phosphopantothenoylcysteine decarboxylase [Ruminococcus sp.]
ADIIIKAAAVADYRPASYSGEKIKKADSDLSIPLERTQDILKYLGETRKPGQFLCGFSMETENMLENSRAKLARKNADLIAANSLRDAGSGFGTDTNHLVLISKDSVDDLPLLSKEDAADRVLDALQKQ